MIAYEPEHWTDLFVAAAGASAALAGLVFVAVSINVEQILKFHGLPERALGTVLLLLSVVIVSLAALTPGQSMDALGIELLVVGLLLGTMQVRLALASRGQDDSGERSHVASAIGVVTPGTLGLLIGGVSLIAETGGGLYWIVVALAFAIVGGVINAWVLMVEILR